MGLGKDRPSAATARQGGSPGSLGSRGPARPSRARVRSWAVSAGSRASREAPNSNKLLILTQPGGYHPPDYPL